MVSQGTQKRSSRRKAKGQRSPLSSSGVLKLPQKMVHAVDQHHKEGQCRLALGVHLRVGCQPAKGRTCQVPTQSRQRELGKIWKRVFLGFSGQPSPSFVYFIFLKICVSPFTFFPRRSRGQNHQNIHPSQNFTIFFNEPAPLSSRSDFLETPRAPLLHNIILLKIL